MNNDKPYDGFGPVRLTTLINEINNSDLQVGIDFTFGTPLPYTDDEGRNTKVKINPTSRRKRKQDVFYTRLELTALDRLPDGMVAKVVIPEVPFSIRSILPDINTALGIDLTEDEIQDASFSEKLSEYPLRIIESISLGWLDSDFKFKARHTGDVLTLADLTPLNTLDGFTFVQ